MSRTVLSYRWVIPALGFALALVPPPARVAAAPERTALTFAAGRALGNYNAVAAAVAEGIEARGGRVEILATQGSYDNAELLREGRADLALLQSDVAFLEHFNRRPFLALASIYTEPIHVIAYRGLDLRRLSDLATVEEPLTIAVGAPGSGSAAHALALLDQLDLPEDRVEIVQESIDRAADDLRIRKVDVVFVTSAVPSLDVRRLAGERLISLLDVDRDFAARLRRRNPFFVAAEIPYDAYDASRNVQTLGTRTLLAGRPDLSAEDVELVLDALYAAAGRADAERLPFLRGLSPEIGFEDFSVTAHPAAVRYHSERRSRFRRWVDGARENAFTLVLLAVAMIVLFRLSRLAYFVHQFVLGRVLLSLVAVWLAGSAAMHFFEHAKNSAFRSFGSSSIAILHYLFSGLESKYPVTTGGNVVAILVLSLGVGVVTLFTASLVTVLVEHALNVKSLRRKPLALIKLSGHTVVAGWSERTERIVRQLRSPDLRKRPVVVVVASDAAATRVEDRHSFRGVWVVEGDRSQAAVLRKADIATAASAVIVASDALDGDADYSAICCALAIERLAPQVHTVVEARDATAVERLRRTRADEIVDTATLAERLLSQCVITPGIARVYDELLSFGYGSQEIYLLPLARMLDGRCLRELRERFRSCDALLLGFWRRGDEGPRLNPRPHECELPLASGGPEEDRLVVLADSPRALAPSREHRPWQRRRENGTGERSRDAPEPGSGYGSGGAPFGVPEQCSTRIGICGWNRQARAVIRQLRESVISRHRSFEIVVIGAPDGALDGDGESFPDVRLVAGDPTRTGDLEQAGVADLDVLVVLADRSDEERERVSDHRALVICLAVRELAPELHLVAEVLHCANHEHFRRLQGIEIVSVEDLAEKLLAQSVISPGITAVFLELLTASEDSNEIYVVPIPPRWHGRRFDHIAAEVQDGDQPVLALGYRTANAAGDAAVVLNPRRQESERDGVADWVERPLGPGDALVVMAYRQPTW